MIVVDEPDALIHRPVAIAPYGLDPRRRVSLTAAQTYTQVARWQ